MTSSDNYESAANKTEGVAQFAPNRRGTMARLQSVLHATPALVPLVVLVMSLIGFTIYVDGPAILHSWGMSEGAMRWGIIDPDTSARVLERFRFIAPRSLTKILEQVQIVGILAVAQSLIILTAGIDLSVGAIMVFSSIIMGQFTFRYGLPPEIAVLCGLAAGAAIGFCNGVLVAIVKLPPFIVTLGMWLMVASGTYIYSKNETIRGTDIEAQAPFLDIFDGGFEFGSAELTWGVIFMFALVFLFAYILNHTAWGRHVYAVGDDIEAAQLAGVKTKRVLISVYVVAGLICALAGWVLIARTGAVTPQVGDTANIDAITAVVIGGISLFGGRGSILGPLFGAMIVGVYNFALPMTGLDPQGKELFIGGLIILAVLIDQWIRKVSA